MAMTRFQKKLLVGLFVMALLSPLGILLPEKFHSGDAWGEWGLDRIEKMFGYIPAGMKKIADLWKAPVADYNFGGEGASATTQVLSYILSGFVGVLMVCAVVYSLSKFLVRHKHDNKDDN